MIDKEYQEINSYINSINSKILGTKDDIYYIANDTLTRNSFATKILSSKEDIPNTTLWFMIISFIKYYLKAFLLFFIFIAKSVIYKIVRKKSKIDNQILIDTYFVVDKVANSQSYKDSYFIGIDTLLKKSEYTYLVKSFYGSVLNLKKFYRVIKVLNRSERNIISEFDFINILDMFKILIFILLYPFKIKKVFSQNRGVKSVFDYSLIESLNGSDFKSYIRYITGKNIASQYSFKKIISWCEYQNIDKAFYKAVNESGKNITIYGCQFLVPYNSWLNFFIPKSEKSFNLTPTTVLTNGKYYLDFIELDKRVGVSLRYKHIFNKQNSFVKEEYILLLGSFIKSDTLRLIEFAKSSSLNANIILRLHPTQDFDMYKDEVDSSWILSKDSTLNEDIAKSFMIITNDATGTSLETVCSEKSTIVVANRDKFYSIPLVEYGKGKIWDIAFNKNDIEKLYNTLLKYREENMDEIKEIASWYRDNFFVEPNEENIVKAFELEKSV
jgi:hypothetical protein